MTDTAPDLYDLAERVARLEDLADALEEAVMARRPSAPQGTQQSERAAS